MLYPAGLNHSKKNIVKAETWTATITTNNQDAASKGSEKNLEFMALFLLTKGVHFSFIIMRQYTDKVNIFNIYIPKNAVGEIMPVLLQLKLKCLIQEMEL